jgi:AraC-like DNA-binding protein
MGVPAVLGPDLFDQVRVLVSTREFFALWHWIGDNGDDPAVGLDETAYLAGYEDSNSFVRAFHAWEEIAPARWRGVQREKGAS